MDPILEVKNPQTFKAKTASAVTNIPAIKPARVQPAVEVKRGPSGVYINIMTKEELNKKMQIGKDIQIVNVLAPEKYTLGFIRGSIRIPLEELDARMSELDKSKPVVTYCASSDCSASKSAAEKLTAKGFNVSAYEGGIKEWKEAGLPITEA